MSRFICKLLDTNDYINLPNVEEMHEDGEFIKVYKKHNELLAVIKTSECRQIYLSEKD